MIYVTHDQVELHGRREFRPLKKHNPGGKPRPAARARHKRGSWASAPLSMLDRGRDNGLGRPSLRTGQADFRHSALQLVVTFEKISRRILDLSGSLSGCLPLPRRPTDSGLESKVRVLVLLFTELSPVDIYGAVFLRSFVQRLHLPASLDSTGITPLLRYYGGSVTFRARFFGPSTDHERRSFPES